MLTTGNRKVVLASHLYNAHSLAGKSSAAASQQFAAATAKKQVLVLEEVIATRPDDPAPRTIIVSAYGSLATRAMV